MPDKQDLEPLLNTQQNDLSLTFSDGNSIDSRALAMLATNVAILIFIGQASLGSVLWWQYILLLGPLFASLVLDTWAIWPRHYRSASVDLLQHPEYMGMSRTELILQLLTDTIASIAINTELNAQRLRLCLASVMLTAFGAAILFAILLL